MTPERLAEIRARCDDATEGPWEFDETGAISVVDEKGGGSVAFIAPFASVHTITKYKSEFFIPDAAFVTKARTDLPELLDAYEELLRKYEAVTASRLPVDHEADAQFSKYRDSAFRRAEGALSADLMRANGTIGTLAGLLANAQQDLADLRQAVDEAGVSEKVEAALNNLTRDPDA